MEGKTQWVVRGVDKDLARQFVDRAGRQRRPTGFVSFQGKWCKCQTDAHQRLYQATEIKSRSAATRWTWMTRRRASETLWLM
jgi:hypothetical protein